MGRWVAARHAVTAGSGEELIRVAHRLEDLPAIGAAYGAGEPSWDQTRFLARFATPETDEVLAWRGARTSVNALALEARRHEPAPEPKTENRFLDVRPDTTGYHLKGWLPGFDTKTWRAELPSGIQLGDETFRRLCCDARFEAIGRADGQLVTAAAPHRNIPRWLRRAAKRRDHGCRFPGCVHIRRIQLHHVVPCAVHGLTVLENLITLPDPDVRRQIPKPKPDPHRVGLEPRPAADLSVRVRSEYG